MVWDSDMEDFEFLHEHEKGFKPSGEFIESRSKVPILEYGMDYYCFADIVIGPVLPAVYLTNPLFATDNEGKPHYYGRERVGRYPGGTWWDWGPDEPKSSTMRIEPVPISPVNVMGETVVPYERWVESYRNLPGTPFYSSLDDSGDYCDKASVFDPHGREAYRRAMFYMEEAMRVHRAYSGEDERQRFHDCVKLAEILFRHAAGRGDARAWVALGKIYKEDLNNGDYFNSYYTASIKGHPPMIEQPPIGERARICFERAAELGDPEALVFLGDLRIEGMVCERDESAAFELYRRAYALVDERHAMHYIKASAALRLARCLEYGVGCEIDLMQARDLYRFAHTYLRAIARTYFWWFARERREAMAHDQDLTQLLSHPSHVQRVALSRMGTPHPYESVTKFLPMLESMGEFGDVVNPFYVSYNGMVLRFMDEVNRVLDRQPDLGFFDYLGLLHAKLLDAPIDVVDPADYDARTVMAMIIYVVRQEKFGEGLMLHSLNHGLIQRWLRRLVQIDDERASS